MCACIFVVYLYLLGKCNQSFLFEPRYFSSSIIILQFIYYSKDSSRINVSFNRGPVLLLPFLFFFFFFSPTDFIFHPEKKKNFFLTIPLPMNNRKNYFFSGLCGLSNRNIQVGSIFRNTAVYPPFFSYIERIYACSSSMVFGEK